MATVNQTPAALSLAGNLKPFKISSTESVQFRLLKGGVELLSQRYEPGADGVLEIDVKAVVFASLAYAINSGNSYVQSAIAADFIGEVDGASFAFRAIRGGVANLADTDSNWLRNHFLTWQPKIKPVTYYSPEWLTYYGVQEATIKLLATFDGGATQTLTLASVAAGTAVTVNVQYASIAGRLGNVYPTHYKVWAESTAGARLTDEQFYTYSEPLSDDEQWYLFENSLGGLDTFRAYGVNNFDGTHTHQIAEFGETYKEYDVEAERVYNKNTGYLNDYARVWMLDFFPSRDKYIYEDNAIRKIVVTDSDVKYVSSDLPSAYSFSYKFADKTRYLNLIRNESELPANLVVPNLDAPDFIFPPRLSELPRILLTEGVLIPAFDPNSPTATVTTFGEIKQVIVEAVLASLPTTGESPGTGTLVVLLPSTDDITEATDLNVFTARRAMGEINKAINNLTTGISNKYLRKDIPDSAKEKITFEKGLQIGPAFAPGLLGGNVDERGNAELESLTVRSFLKVWDLIINRLTAVESDYIFSEADTIDEVVDLGQNTYRLTLRKKWDGYFTAQVENNVIFGVVNTLASGSGGDYYTSWMRVLSVNTTDNTITVLVYPNNEVPGNTNFAPVKGMVVARKGNSDSPLDGSRNERQDFWNLSSSDGRITFLRDVAKPILEEYNFALSIGRLPALQKFKGLPISDSEMAVYAKYIIGENFFTIDKEGRPVTQEVHRGAWSAAVAATDPYRRLVHESENEEGVVSNVLAVHTVYHRGMKWACLIDRTLLEPTWNSPGWQFLEGNGSYSIEFHSSAGSAFFAEVNTVLTAQILYGNEDITDSVIAMQATDIQWTRNSGNIPDDNAWLPVYDGPKNKLILTTRDMGVNWRVSRTTAFTVTFFLPIGDIITESISFNI